MKAVERRLWQQRADEARGHLACDFVLFPVRISSRHHSLLSNVYITPSFVVQNLLMALVILRYALEASYFVIDAGFKKNKELNREKEQSIQCPPCL